MDHNEKQVVKSNDIFFLDQIRTGLQAKEVIVRNMVTNFPECFRHKSLRDWTGNIARFM